MGALNLFKAFAIEWFTSMSAETALPVSEKGANQERLQSANPKDANVPLNSRSGGLRLPFVPHRNVVFSFVAELKQIDDFQQFGPTGVAVIQKVF